MSFKFIQPDSLPAALSALAEYGDEAKVIAGGTAVVLMLQQKLIAPTALVSLGRLSNLDYVRPADDGLRIGPLALLSDLERSPALRRHYPALAHACAEVGNIRVRNQATLGGNLAEADYASDPPAMLLALNASVTATNQSGARTIPLSDFFFGFYTTALEPDELITDIVIPPLAEDSRMSYLSYKSRSSEDRPCVVVSAVAEFDNGACQDLRVAVGAACDVPTRLPAVEAMAKGQTLSDALVSEIAEAYASNIETLEDLRGSAWYRTEMIKVHIRRALKELQHGHR